MTGNADQKPAGLRRSTRFDGELEPDRFDLTATYLREVKSGTRGAGGGSIRGFSDNIVEVPEPLNELTQDIGFRNEVDILFKCGTALTSQSQTNTKK